jgi:arylsulfatase A-like enzyme
MLSLRQRFAWSEACLSKRDQVVDGHLELDVPAGSALLVRGWKTELYEGGIRVPFIVQWMGHLPAGAVYRNPVVSRDILPTFAKAAGIHSKDWFEDKIKALF